LIPAAASVSLARNSDSPITAAGSGPTVTSAA
jgi:hypothetical protein